jgi:hypothetical protein
MEPSPPGWYRDPHSPGGRRYWDGQHWVDVDAVLDGQPEPGPVTRTGPRLISQRSGEQEQVEPPESTDDVETESHPD